MFAALCGAFLFPGLANAWDDLNIPSILKEPGVKLVAVDFYATWCKPCNAALPKWTKLMDKYRSRGLRVLLVSVQSEQGCARPDFQPDKIICDYEGDIAKQWNAKDLPKSFLFSWQGNTLVSGGEVEEVERAVEGYFAGVPRILVETPTAGEGRPLPKAQAEEMKRTVRGELRRSAKFDLVADEAEQKTIKEARAKAHGANFDDAAQCEMGADVSPNSLLKTTLVKKPAQDRLALELFSLEKGCLTASAYVPVMNNDTDQAIVEGVVKLISQLVQTNKALFAAPPRKETAPPVAVVEPPAPKPAAPGVKEVQVGEKRETKKVEVLSEGEKVSEAEIKAMEERERKERKERESRIPWYPGSPAIMGPGLAPTNDFSFGIGYTPYGKTKDRPIKFDSLLFNLKLNFTPMDRIGFWVDSDILYVKSAATTISGLSVKSASFNQLSRFGMGFKMLAYNIRPLAISASFGLDLLNLDAKKKTAVTAIRLLPALSLGLLAWQFTFNPYVALPLNLRTASASSQTVYNKMDKFVGEVQYGMPIVWRFLSALSLNLEFTGRSVYSGGSKATTLTFMPGLRFSYYLLLDFGVPIRVYKTNIPGELTPSLWAIETRIGFTF